MAQRQDSGRCPLCGRPARQESRPFCSRRCADLDLGRWLGERYVVSRPDPNAEAEDLPGPDGADRDGDGGGVRGGI